MERREFVPILKVKREGKKYKARKEKRERREKETRSGSAGIKRREGDWKR